jgi:hypothetical protein
MDTLRTHYARLLELNDSWEMADVALSVEEHRVEFGSSRLEGEFSALNADGRAESPTIPKNAVGGISTPWSSSRSSWFGCRCAVALSTA